MKNKIICLAFGVILSLVLAELLLRIAAFSYNLVYKTPENYKNSYYRILCVGESTTCGIGASDPALYNYPRQLQEKLNKKFPDLGIKCVFDPSIGVNTTQNLIKLPSIIKKYQPNLVVFMAGINNWWNLDKSNILLFNKNERLQQALLNLRMFLERFRVYKLFKWLVYSYGLIRLEDQINWPEENVNDEESTKLRLKMAFDLRESIEEKYNSDIFIKIAYYDLQEMIKICKEKKITVIICNYASRANPLLARAHKELSFIHNCYFVDNQSFFSSLSDDRDYFYRDGHHPNDKGYGIIAENIYNCILEHKLIR